MEGAKQSGLPIVALLLLILVGCGPEATAPPTSTAIPRPSSLASAASEAATPASPRAIPAAPTAATLDPLTSRGISDGFCRVTVPRGWVDDGTGSGRTSGGHAFSLFGGRLPDAATWDRAAALFRDQAAARAGATLTEGADFLRVVYADDRGFAHRTRFADRYCDLRVTARGDPIAASEQAAWDAVVASLEPAT